MAAGVMLTQTHTHKDLVNAMVRNNALEIIYSKSLWVWVWVTANLPTNIVNFGGFDSSIILILRVGILMSIGNFPESLSQAILMGVMLVGRLGVAPLKTL